jgi:hypothetical protein
MRGLEGVRRKENDWEWIILKYTASVYEDDITKCTERFWIKGRWRSGEESIIEGVNLTKVQYYSCVKYHGKIHWTMNIHLKNKDRNVNLVLIRYGYQWEGTEWMERVKEVEYGWCIFYRTIEVEQFLLKLWRMGVWSRKRMMERVNLTKVHCKPICKCYSKNS